MPLDNDPDSRCEISCPYVVAVHMAPSDEQVNIICHSLMLVDDKSEVVQGPRLNDIIFTPVAQTQVSAADSAVEGRQSVYQGGPQIFFFAGRVERAGRRAVGRVSHCLMVNIILGSTLVSPEETTYNHAHR